MALRDRERLSHILGVSFTQKTKQQWHRNDEETSLKVSRILGVITFVETTNNNGIIGIEKNFSIFSVS